VHLIKALAEVDPKYIVQREEHLAKYDGRPTTAKLNMLTEEKGLPRSFHNQIWRLKQEKTYEVINDSYKYDDRLRLILSSLKKKGYMIYCASNSIYRTLQLMLIRKGVLEYFDFILSCQDVLHPKVIKFKPSHLLTYMSTV
jgi:beta-phosphoglucomutase